MVGLPSYALKGTDIECLPACYLSCHITYLKHILYFYKSTITKVEEWVQNRGKQTQVLYGITLTCNGLLDALFHLKIKIIWYQNRCFSARGGFCSSPMYLNQLWCTPCLLFQGIKAAGVQS